METNALAVAELIKQHSAAISKLKEQTVDYATKDIGVKYDDLFILRFLLSAKGEVKPALKKLRETLQWRVDNLSKLNNAALGKLPYQSEVAKHAALGNFGFIGNDLLFVVRFGLGDCATLMTKLTETQAAEFLIMMNESHFRALDAKTRETGQFSKLVVLADLYGMSLSRFSRKFISALGANSHQSSTYFPQLLRCTTFLHMPTPLRYLFNTLKLVLTAESQDKQRVCPGKPHNGKQNAGDCPFLRSKLGSSAAAVALMPPFLGGNGEMPGHLKVAGEL